MLDAAWWEETGRGESWAAALREADEHAAAIREATFSGRPYGSQEYLRGLEQALGRRLARGKGGRPPKPQRASQQLSLWTAQ